MSTAVIAELPRLRRAFYTIAAAAILFAVFFCIMGAFVLYGDRDKPQFPYELVIALAGATYFGVLSVHTLRGAKGAFDESKLPQSLAALAQAVFGMFIPIALSTSALIWFIFQPAY